MAETRETQHFLDYWRIVQGRKEVVIAAALFIIVAGIAITLSLPRVYMASARIAVRQDLPTVTPFQYRPTQQQMMLAGYDPYFLRTQFEIIQSRPILYDVIRNLRLQEHYGRMYSENGAPLSLQDAYRILQRSMKVQQYRDTNLIEIRIYCSTRRSDAETARQDAARIANEIAAVYRDQRMRLNREETKRGLEAMSEAYREQQQKVAEAEAKVEQLRKELNVSVIGVPGTGRGGPLDTARLERLELNRIQARNNMIERRTRLEGIERLTGDELLYSAALVVNDPALAALRQNLIEAETTLRKLQESYGERHPDVVRAESVAADMRRKLDETLKGIKMGLQTDYEIARKELEAIEADLAAARASDIRAHGEKYLPFMKAESELERQRQIRDTLEMRLVQEQIEMELPRTPVEVVDVAEPPDASDPVSPKVVLNVVLSVLVGLGCGVGLAFFTEYMDTSVKTVEDIEQYIGASIVGVIPQKVRPLLEEGADSPHAEAYRVLRMNLQLSKKLSGGNTVCVTSGGAGEGKSLTLFNLAYVCAQLGERVLVVDSDLRRPTQHKMFKLPNRVGLADVLMGKAAVADVIETTPVAGLDFLPSGKLPSASHGLLSSQRLREIIGQLKGRYDYVFFDAPPIMGVSDAAVLSSEVDGVLLIVQHRSYPRAVSSRAKAMVENVGGNLIGVVLNNLNVTRDYYYYYYQNYYYHKPQAGSAGGAAARAAEGKGRPAGSA